MVIKKTITDNSSLSNSGEKRSQLLIKVDNLMEKMDNEYGPFILDELSKRLEMTIEEFHNDLKSLLTHSFNEHNSKLSVETKDSSKPVFIAEYEKKVKNK